MTNRLLVGFALALAFCYAVAVEASLGSAAAGAGGRYFGVAISAGHTSDSRYTAIWDAEFSSTTCENEMKWDALEWNQNQFNFGNADNIFNHATSRGQKFRGHTLVWHSQLPDWAKNSGNLKAAMNNHITKVMQHYKGKMYCWDVVNEAFSDDGSGQYGLRGDSPFMQKIGSGFMEEAFRTARAADPDAKLCYNDYNIEWIGTKSTNVYNMVKDFKSRGVPIDCVGFQTHLGGSVPGDFQQNLQRFADLGVDVQITELDVGANGQAQSNTYAGVVKACLGVSRCTGITVWGIIDDWGWRHSKGDDALLWDGNFNKKPAYTATVNAFGSAPPVDCKAPADPANGKFACSGSKCVAVCTAGYAATGAGYATCSNNVWSTLPACVPTGSGSMACGIADEGKAMAVTCDSGSVLNAVEFASYGTPEGDCTNSKLGACHADSSLTVVQDACVGKASCSVNAANSVFGDPCSGTIKKLAMRGHCAAATSVCTAGSEYSTVILSCPSGKNIYGISFASYGTPAGDCGSFAKSSCHASSSLDVVQKTCVGKNSCSFENGKMNGIFGDPCSGTGKQLKIQALCS